MIHIFLRRYYFYILLCLGVIFRLILFHFTDPQLRWDAFWYKDSALDVLQGKFVADCCSHGAGYPLFLAPFLYISRESGIDYVRLFQFFLDIGTGTLLGLTARKIFRLEVSVATFFIYLFNPFTASYNAIIMTETLTIFVIAMLVYIVTLNDLLKRSIYWIVLGIFLGFLALIKPGMLWFTEIFIFGLPFVFGITKNTFRYYLLVVASFFLILSYAFFANYVTFRKISPTPPYQANYWGVYLSFYINHRPELLGEFDFEHPEFVRAEQQYFYWVQNDISQIPKYETIYKQMVIQKLQTEWPIFIKNTIRNFFLIWNKYHLYLYTDPLYPADTWILQIINVLYFVLGVFGLISAYKILRKKYPILLFMTVSLFLYISLLFSVVSNLTRHSLPYYPILLFWSGIGLVKMIAYIKQLKLFKYFI